ncbi:hypothetical protein E5676_scaffold1799G00060 [Cucumis melo var. makuwa]|uniref:Uncharacterized protein n=1 Tax=Cucumis melo var. makuwa TaxID=1194695 RepID=A0A5A7V368_CUCMM|nr:hypothetical protein E6C27_scaffold6213G00130 [Cucumis melo var. makuwa]TYK14265.1 hypothetical protein E5676_scaffold1799G00060 [Cucumis melo var. makuwa]
MPRTQFSRRRAKMVPQRFLPFGTVLVISLSIFEARTLRTSTHTSGMLPHMFTQGIGREASSLEGELWFDPKRFKRWPMLATSGERLSGVRNHWKCTCSGANRLSSRTSGVCPMKTRPRMSRTQFSRPRAKSDPPMVSSLCSVLVISLSIFGACTPRTSRPTYPLLNNWFKVQPINLNPSRANEKVGPLVIDLDSILKGTTSLLSLKWVAVNPVLHPMSLSIHSVLSLKEEADWASDKKLSSRMKI